MLSESILNYADEYEKTGSKYYLEFARENIRRAINYIDELIRLGCIPEDLKPILQRAKEQYQRALETEDKTKFRFFAGGGLSEISSLEAELELRKRGY